MEVSCLHVLLFLLHVLRPSTAAAEVGAVRADRVADSCDAFPFFDGNRSLAIIEDVNLSTTDSKYRRGDRGFMTSYPYDRSVAPGTLFDLTVGPPADSRELKDYIDLDAAERCLDEHRGGFNIKFIARLAGNETQAKETFCAFKRHRDLHSSFKTQCPSWNEDFVFQLPNQCGSYNLSVSAQVQIGGTVFAPKYGQTVLLGERTLKLPVPSPMKEIDEGFTWFKFALDNCYPERKYDIQCGSKSFKSVKEGSTLTLDNLFLGWRDNENCQYDLQESSDDQGIKSGPRTLSVSTHWPEFMSTHRRLYRLFSARHDAIFLIARTELDEILTANRNIVATVSVTDLDTNSTFNAIAEEAQSHGIQGLKTTNHYKACLTLAQVEGTCVFECRNLTSCDDISTIPSTGRQSAALTSALWTVIVILTLLVALLLVGFVTQSRRLDAVGAPSTRVVWINMKEKNGKKANDQEAPVNDLLI